MPTVNCTLLDQPIDQIRNGIGLRVRAPRPGMRRRELRGAKQPSFKNELDDGLVGSAHGVGGEGGRQMAFGIWSED
jgi:hypothetical protein